MFSTKLEKEEAIDNFGGYCRIGSQYTGSFTNASVADELEILEISKRYFKCNA